MFRPQKHEGGQGFLIDKNLKFALTKLFTVSDRVYIIVPKLNESYKMQMINIYAPISTSEEEYIV